MRNFRRILAALLRVVGVLGRASVLSLWLLCSQISWSAEAALLPIPDGLVVLTFDDGTKTDLTTVAPILKRDGFMSWEDIAKLNEEGFEIGNHTQNHPDVTSLSRRQVRSEIQGVERAMQAHGLTTPTTFAYPGWQDNIQSAQVLLQKGYQFA